MESRRGGRGRSGGQQRWRDEETHSRGGGRYVAPHRRNDSQRYQDENYTRDNSRTDNSYYKDYNIRYSNREATGNRESNRNTDNRDNNRHNRENIENRGNYNRGSYNRDIISSRDYNNNNNNNVTNVDSISGQFSQLSLSGTQEEERVVGTCQQLEKAYFRLTSKPDPSQVRPEPVLRQWFDILLTRWHNTNLSRTPTLAHTPAQQSNSSSNIDYEYMCDQLKAIRQDLTVQYIRDEFSVEVYETHLRLALQNNDISEFNVCLSVLEHIVSAAVTDSKRMTYAAYRVLYSLTTDDITSITVVLKKFGSASFSHPLLALSLQAVTCVRSGNFHRFFQLYQQIQDQQNVEMQCLIEKLTERVRKSALVAVVKAYRPGVVISYLQQELSFISLQECLDFLRKHNAVLDPTETTLLCKESLTTVKV